ncbi:MAG: DNA replication/repair protein RecF, partial [Acutalibacteraceae bacterium]
MIFKALRLANFRNIRSADIKFSDDVNVICGENAQGKTNLLEALWLFTGTKSFRGAKDKELVLFGEESAKITLFFNDDGRDQRCDIKIDGKRQATLNDVPQSAASEIAGKMPAVIFSPADLGLIKDGPAARRKFLDTSICQLYPAFIDVSKKYIRALDQRNKILKEIKY